MVGGVAKYRWPRIQSEELRTDSARMLPRAVRTHDTVSILSYQDSRRDEARCIFVIGRSCQAADQACVTSRRVGRLPTSPHANPTVVSASFARLRRASARMQSHGRAPTRSNSTDDGTIGMP